MSLIDADFQQRSKTNVLVMYPLVKMYTAACQVQPPVWTRQRRGVHGKSSHTLRSIACTEITNNTCHERALSVDLEAFGYYQDTVLPASSLRIPCLTRNTSSPASAASLGPQFDSLCHSDNHHLPYAAPRRPRTTSPASETRTSQLQRRNNLISRCSTRSLATPPAQLFHWPCRSKRVIADLLQRHHLIGFTLAPKRCSETAHDLLHLCLDITCRTATSHSTISIQRTRYHHDF